MAQYTKKIGLLATATTTYDEPYSLARRYASLDHLSQGRACWNIVTTSYPDDSLNFSRTASGPSGVEASSRRPSGVRSTRLAFRSASIWIP